MGEFGFDNVLRNRRIEPKTIRTRSAESGTDHVLRTVDLDEGMTVKTNWKHQNDAITTDQKNLTDDPRIHEEDKQDFQGSEKNKGFIPGQNEKKTPGKGDNS